jgi:hypothetical protein
MKRAAFILLLMLILNATPPLFTQEKRANAAEVFEKLEMLTVRGDKTESVAVRLRLAEDSMIVESRKDGSVLRSIKYADIKSAEYSYSKHLRWKAGAGVAAGSLVFAPLLFLTLPIAIPLAFSKARRHWLTIRSEQDFAVLKLDKNIR